MKKLPFKSSSLATIGVELELQLINPHSYDLISGAKPLLRSIAQSSYANLVKPEITQSMIEINSSIHKNAQSLAEELATLQKFLLTEGQGLGISYAGGGMHPFQKWSLRKIFPTPRFKNLSRQYQYLSKTATVFGQHIHVGCLNADDALYLTHVLAYYAPQLIALSASSPFYQGVDTGYATCRSNVFNVYPFSGVMPFLPDWQTFSNYFYKIKRYGIVHSMKDFYWDIRPKPEFGTVEVRVCDMPLTLEKSVALAAYLQAIALYLIEERPILPNIDLNHLYNYNRFQAARYGLEGKVINTYSGNFLNIHDFILETLDKVQKYADYLGSIPYLELLKQEALKNYNDADYLRQLLKQYGSLTRVVREQCLLWEKPLQIFKHEDDSVHG